MQSDYEGNAPVRHVLLQRTGIKCDLKKADFQIHHQWNNELFSELRLFACLFVFVYFLKPAYSSFSRRIPYLPHTGQCT